MIKAVLFDVGGVIVEPGDQLNEFVKIFKPQDKQKFLSVLESNLGPLRKGIISETEYWRKVCTTFELDPEIVPNNAWTIRYLEMAPIRNEVVDLIRQLRKQYRIILISNTIMPHVKINTTRGLFKNFDDVLNSSEVHLTKDSDAIFRLALARNDLNAKECIFIDDEEKYIRVAESLGIKGILFNNMTQLKKELISLNDAIIQISHNSE